MRNKSLTDAGSRAVHALQTVEPGCGPHDNYWCSLTRQRNLDAEHSIVRQQRSYRTRPLPRRHNCESSRRGAWLVGVGQYSLVTQNKGHDQFCAIFSAKFVGHLKLLVSHIHHCIAWGHTQLITTHTEWPTHSSLRQRYWTSKTNLTFHWRSVIHYAKFRRPRSYPAYFTRMRLSVKQCIRMRRMTWNMAAVELFYLQLTLVRQWVSITVCLRRVYSSQLQINLFCLVEKPKPTRNVLFKVRAPGL